MAQYALIKNGLILMEGALPYFWSESPDSPKIDMLSLSITELNDLGWFEINEVGKRNLFDKELQYETAYPLSIINGVPTRQWNYHFVDGVESIFLQRNLKLAETCRQACLTEYSGQAFEYELLIREAESFINNTAPDVTQYPLLFSTIDATLTEAERLDLAMIESAKIISKKNDTIRLLTLVRGKRKSIEERIIQGTYTPAEILGFEEEWKLLMEEFTGSPSPI